MADVSFTATAIVAGSGAQTQRGQLGEAGITAGLCLYQKASDGKWYKADCTAAATDAAAGFALGGGGTNQWIIIQTGGDMTCDNLNLSVAAADPVYVLSAAGEICPSSDLAEDDYITVVGAPLSATSLRIGFIVTGVQVTA